MNNHNCLAGMQCPNCKSEGPFFIEVKTQVLMYDDGSEGNVEGDLSWDETSYISCPACSREGRAGDFYPQNQTTEKSEIQTFADTILRVVSGPTEEQ